MTKSTAVHGTGNPQVTGDNPYTPPREAGVGSAPSETYRQAAADQTGYMPYPESGQSQAQYGSAPNPYSPAPVGETSGVRTLWILGFVLGALGLLFPLAGVAGIVCGAVAWSKGSSRGKMATFVAIAGTVIGFAIGLAFYM